MASRTSTTSMAARRTRILPMPPLARSRRSRRWRKSNIRSCSFMLPLPLRYRTQRPIPTQVTNPVRAPRLARSAGPVQAHFNTNSGSSQPEGGSRSPGDLLPPSSTPYVSRKRQKRQAPRQGITKQAPFAFRALPPRFSYHAMGPLEGLRPVLRLPHPHYMRRTLRSIRSTWARRS